jgi:OOP family OmpA-OmpF porin
MSKKRLLALSAAMLLAMPFAASAQQAVTGFYVGGAFGQGEAGNWCDTSGAPAGVGLSSCDDKDSAWKAFAGYRFSRHFAAEATYINFGEYSGTVTAGAASATVNADATGWGVAALGIVPLGNNFELFGKLGFMRGESEATVTVGAFSGTVGDKGTELHYGVGGIYNFTRNLGVRVEWENVNDADLSVLSIGLQYRF